MQLNERISISIQLLHEGTFYRSSCAFKSSKLRLCNLDGESDSAYRRRHVTSQTSAETHGNMKTQYEFLPATMVVTVSNTINERTRDLKNCENRLRVSK